MSEIVHASPLPGRDKTPCCGKIPFELSSDDRMTNDVALVTCGVIEYATGRRMFTYYVHGSHDDLPFQLDEAFKREGFQVKPEVMTKIMERGNPFYEIRLRCWVNTDTGEIGIDRIFPS